MAELDMITESASKVAKTSKLQIEKEDVRKEWKLKPEIGDGIPVPNPKQRQLSTGVLTTDYVIGNGKGLKLGENTKITYEGLLQNGTSFDRNLKRSKPLQFRLGVGQVVRGLELGMEGMKRGGSREIVIPPELG